MFATSARKRHQHQHQAARTVQHESPPLPGGDSTYGVKSLSDWGGDSVASETSAPRHHRLHASATSDADGQQQQQHDAGAGLEAELKSALDDRVSLAGDDLQQPPFPTGSDRTKDTTSHANNDGQRGGSDVANAYDEDALQDTPMPIQPSLSPTLPPPMTPELQSPIPLPVSGTHVSPRDRGLRLTLRAMDQLASSAGPAAKNANDPRSEEDEDTSEPSSPASFASLPSFIASASSMSRTSSPASGTGMPGYDRTTNQHPWQSYEPRSGEEGKVGGSAYSGLHGSSELVLPVLALDEGSLYSSSSSTRLRDRQASHMQRPPSREGASIKIVVLVADDQAQAVAQQLDSRKEVVQTSQGRWSLSLATSGSISVSISIERDHDKIAEHVRDSYVALDLLLHPPTDGGGQQARLAASLVQDYAARSIDWTHAVLVAGSDTAAVEALAGLLPVAAPGYDGHVKTLPMPLSLPKDEESRSPTPSSHSRLDDPTPMPHGESASYFADTGHSLAGPSDGHLVDQLLALATDVTALTSASSAAFLAWQSTSSPPAPPAMAASTSSQHSSSTTPVSSAFESTGSPDPIPTVVRAHGLTEWEANLSRRLAKRKDLANGEASSLLGHRSHRDRGTREPRSRRRSSRETIGLQHVPLFPPAHTKGKDSLSNKKKALNESGPVLSRKTGIVGLADLVSKTFEPFRWIVRSRWTWGAAAAVAFAVAVGWGYWGKA